MRLRNVASSRCSTPQRAADAGRGPLPITLFNVTPDRGLLDAFAEAGADRCLFTLDDERADEALSTLDGWAKLVQR